MMMTEFNFGFNYDIFLKTLYDIAGNLAPGLQAPNNYSFTEYNNGRKDKLLMDKQNLYLTLDEDTYTVYNEGGEEIDTRPIKQDEKGIDTEDRVLVGLGLLNKYMNIFDAGSWNDMVNRLEWK